MKTGPPTPDEAAHALGALNALRLDEWPDDAAYQRFVKWMRLFEKARQRKRKSAKDWAREKARKAPKAK